MASAAEAASAKTSAPASAAKAATAAAGRAGPRLGAHAAGTGLAVRPGRVPEMVDEHIPGTEAAGVAVAQLPEDPHHRPNDEDGDDQRQEQGSHACVLVLVVPVVVIHVVNRHVVGAVGLIQHGGPVGILHHDVHGIAVAHIPGRDHHAGIGDGHVTHGVGRAAEITGDAGGIVPRQGHHADLRLVKPAGGVVVGYHIAVQRVHELLHPRIGKGEGLAVVIGPVKVDVHEAVVVLQTLDIVSQGRLLPDGAVGNADLQLLPVGQGLQGRPLQRDGHVQAAVIGIGGDGDVVAVDIVVVRPGGDAETQGKTQAQQQRKKLFHSAASFPRSWQR